MLGLYFSLTTTTFRGGYYSANRQYIEGLPVSFGREKGLFNADMVRLVQAALRQRAQLKEAKTSHDERVADRQVRVIDGAIDRLVYELFELTEAEVEIVEDWDAEKI